MEISNELSIPLLEEICLMKVNNAMKDNTFFDEITKQISSTNKDDLVNKLLQEDDDEFTNEELNDMKAAIELCSDKEISKIDIKNGKM